MIFYQSSSLTFRCKYYQLFGAFTFKIRFVLYSLDHYLLDFLLDTFDLRTFSRFQFLIGYGFQKP